MDYFLHAVITLPQPSWGAAVGQAVAGLLRDYPHAQTKVNGVQLIIDLTGQADAPAALAALQALGRQLNPDGLTVVEAANGGGDTSAAPWTGHYATGPSGVVSAWLDRQLGYANPVTVQLRRLPTPGEAPCSP